MRTATRIALVLMGTAIFVAAMATPGARAGRNLPADRKHAPLVGMTPPQGAQRQPRPDRIDYVVAGKVLDFATAVARLSPAPEGVDGGGGDRRTASRLALARTSDTTKNRSISWNGSCHRSTFATQQVNASDGGREALGAAAEGGSCSQEDGSKRRMRQAVIGDPEQMQVPRPEPAPVVIRFEAIISIDLAGLNW